MKILNATKLLLACVYAAGGVLLIVLVLPFSGYKALTVATPSMAPAVPQGSLVLIHRVPTAGLKVGDIVTYINPRNTHQTITHRIVKTEVKNGLPYYVTKGDANRASDPQILGGTIVGKVEFHSLLMGQIAGFIRNPFGIILLVILPAILIIIDEVRRLRRIIKYNERGPQEEIGDHKSPSRPIVATIAPTQGIAKPKRRSMDSIVIKTLAFLAAVSLAAGGTTYAGLVSAPATLTNNTISAIVPLAVHLQINRVFIGTTGSAFTCPPSFANVSITNTAPGTTNNASVNTNCTITSTNSTSVTISNFNTQASTSGSVTQTSSTTGQGATTGSVSNNNSSSTSISINNGSTSAPTPAEFVELYNPTNAAINLAGWSLIDNSGVPRALSGSIAAHGFTLVGGSFGSGLSGVGDHLILRNTFSTIIDAVSWGSDTTQLNPSLAAIPLNASIVRKTPGLDTDSASDWNLLSP